MRCLDCHYSLKNLTEHRCPECGRAFDPDDPSTVRYSEKTPWTRVMILLGCVFVLSSIALRFLLHNSWGPAVLGGAFMTLFGGVFFVPLVFSKNPAPDP